MEILRVENLTKVYGKGENEVRALDGVSFSVEKGEFVAIVGSSGSGKSTLLHMLGGLDIPSEGEVWVDGKELSKLNENQLAVFRRRKIGFVFQNYNLIPLLSVYENIILPRQLDGKKADYKFVEELLSLLGLKEKMESFPNELSGGQQQRVAIARALATRPAILLADEPTGNLDSKASQDVISLMKAMNEHYSQTIVLITHNQEIAQLAGRIIRIEDGKILK